MKCYLPVSCLTIDDSQTHAQSVFIIIIINIISFLLTLEINNNGKKKNAWKS